MTRSERIDGLGSARLAAYDDTLAAGPRGLALAELAPIHGHAAVAWLVRAGWLIEYTPGRYRAAAKEAVLTAPETENADCGMRSAESEPRKECGNQGIRNEGTTERGGQGWGLVDGSW